MSLRHLLTAFLSFSLPATIFAQTGTTRAEGVEGETPCRVIRRLGYPFGKRADDVREVRYALLDTCPDGSRPSARPLIQVTVRGEKRLREFDVVRFFRDRREAEVYARQHNILDFKTGVGDYRVLPQLRPAVSYLEALDTSDFELFRSAFGRGRKPPRLKSADFWDALRNRHTSRLRKKFGRDYSSADLDFRFVPSGKSGRAGRVEVVHEGRTFTDFLRVVFVEEAGGWRLVMREGR